MTTFALKPYVSPPRPPSPSRPRISSPSVIQNHTTVIQNHYHQSYGFFGGGYGGGYYHPWYHPVLVWPTYGNYSTGAVGGVESLLVFLIVAAIVGLLGYSGWKLWGSK